MIYRFEHFTVDTERREIHHRDAPVEVEPQVFDLLAFLIRERGRVVTRDELVAGVWKGRVVSESTINSRVAAARRAVGDSGERQDLIRTVRRVGLRFVGEVREARAAKPFHPPGRARERPDGEPRLPVPASPVTRVSHKPSLTVQPFLDLSDPDGRGEFVRGVVEDVMTALAQCSWLSMIARPPATDTGDWMLDISERDDTLALHYVLEGSVRRVGRRVRVAVMLLDPATRLLLWAKRFDLEGGDLLNLQDRITSRIVGALVPRLEQLEIERARDADARLDPLRCYFLGVGRLYQWSREGIGDAFALFRRATMLDPELAIAYGMAAYCHVQMKSYGWTTDCAWSAADCAGLAQRAAVCARDDPLALTKAAHATASVVHDMESASDFIDQALRLNPHLAAAWYVAGWIRLFLGDPEGAVAYETRAMRLGRFDPLVFKVHAALGYAHFLSGRYDDAIASAERAMHARPQYLTAMRLAAAGHALAGRLTRAKVLGHEVQELDPNFRLANLPSLIPFHRPADMQRWADALGKAGIPE